VRKSDIENEISQKFNLNLNQSEQILDAIIESITDVLKVDGRIEIREFGSFFTKNYGSYKGRNPRTGQPVHVPVKKLPHFKASKEFLKSLNNNESGNE